MLMMRVHKIRRKPTIPREHGDHEFTVTDFAAFFFVSNICSTNEFAIAVRQRPHHHL